jgi:DNA helicase II / ATP-dependent DNA helicase PcrA
MNSLAQLNPEQREAVEHVDGPLLILAGAGSGKTRVIVHRIAHLIGEKHARPGEILAVTFTNKAAEEMRTRVERLLGGECRDIWLSTFHALCARLLRRDAPAIGLPREFVIYDSADQIAAVKQVMRELQIDEAYVQPRAALSRISSSKNRMESAETLLARKGNPREEQIGRIYARYQQVLASNGALDFDDLLLRSVDLLKSEAGKRYAGKFRYVMVDEYQDTNRPQYLLIRLLAAAHQNICVVGDPDQSIYQWRGADLKNILDFEEDFPDTTVVRLERNYRSTQVILDAASAVISRNLLRKEKRLWTERQGGDRITYLRAADELEEADFIARNARIAVREDSDARMAVLYRINAQSRVIEDALRREGVSYRIFGGVRFYERKEVKDALAYLKLMLNPDNDVSFRRVVNVPARGIGKTVMEALENVPAAEQAPLLAEASPGSASLWVRLERGLADNRFTGRQAASLRAFRELILALREMAAREPLSTVIGKMLDRSGYLQDLREDRSEESEARIENLAELVSAAREFETRQGDATLAGFVDQLSLLSDADEVQGSQDARVLLMTLHSAKGLEFPVVAIAGLEEGLFPHSRANADDDDLEEERRLCYVGMTRAQDRLIITSASRRRVFGEYRNTEPSRFVDEIPQALVKAIAPQTTSYRSAYLQPDVRSPGSYGRSGARRVREEQPSGFSYDNEDQSAAGGFGRGTRVRHPQFGIGTVQDVEQVGDDVKLTVKFASVGQKRLIGKYAKLELA